MNPTIKFQPEYNAIKNFYGDNTAKRSGVKLINHIHEGLEILDILGSTMDAQRAYCLHPLIQNDAELLEMTFNDVLFSFSPRVVLLGMEYRQRANDWLSDKVSTIAWTREGGRDVAYVSQTGTPSPGNLTEVKDMLLADKIQNYKDFVLYHKETHQRSRELDKYFQEWFVALDITTWEYQSIVTEVNERMKRHV